MHANLKDNKISLIPLYTESIIRLIMRCPNSTVFAVKCGVKRVKYILKVIFLCLGIFQPHYSPYGYNVSMEIMVGRLRDWEIMEYML